MTAPTTPIPTLVSVVDDINLIRQRLDEAIQYLGQESFVVAAYKLGRLEQICANIALKHKPDCEALEASHGVLRRKPDGTYPKLEAIK